MNARQRLLGVTIIEAALFIVILGIVAAVIYPVFAQQKLSMKNPCLSRLKQLGSGSIMYAADYDERLPSSARWMDLLQPYRHSEADFHDYAGISPGGYGYGFRKSASGLTTSAIRKPQDFVMNFDSLNQERNASGNLELLPKPGRHHGMDSIVFADGHAGSVPTDDRLFPILRNDKLAGPK